MPIENPVIITEGELTLLFNSNFHPPGPVLAKKGQNIFTTSTTVFPSASVAVQRNTLFVIPPDNGVADTSFGSSGWDAKRACRSGLGWAVEVIVDELMVG